MAMPQQGNYIEQIRRLEANRPLRGFATLGEANTPSASERAELMAYAEAHGDWEELERLKERLRRLVEKV